MSISLSSNDLRVIFYGKFWPWRCLQLWDLRTSWAVIKRQGCDLRAAASSALWQQLIRFLFREAFWWPFDQITNNGFYVATNIPTSGEFCVPSILGWTRVDSLLKTASDFGFTHARRRLSLVVFFGVISARISSGSWHCDASGLRQPQWQARLLFVGNNVFGLSVPSLLGSLLLI